MGTLGKVTSIEGHQRVKGEGVESEEDVFGRDARDEILDEPDRKVLRFLVNVEVTKEVEEGQEERGGNLRMC